MAKISWRKRLVFSFIAIALSIIFALLLGEIYVRLFSEVGYVTPEIYQQQQLLYSPAIFCRHVHPQVEHTAVDKDGNPRWYINEKGYRGRNFDVEKPEGTIRIIIYGGSFVFDGISPEGKDWPHRIETILRKKGFPQVEVINAGIGGHASFDSVGRLWAEGHTFNPDYVILCNGWNDIKYFRSGKTLLREFKPYPGNPFVEYQGGMDKLLCTSSQLYVRLRDRYYKSKLNLDAEGIKPVGESSSKVSEAGLRQYRLNCELFVDLAENINACPILLTPPRLVSPDNTEAEKKRIKYEYQLLTHEALCKTFAGIDETIRDISKTKGNQLIDASAEITGKNEYFSDHVHLSREGSEKLARFCAAKLIKIFKAPEETE